MDPMKKVTMHSMRCLPVVWVLALATGTVPVAADTDPPPHLGYGFMLAFPPGNLSRVPAASFDWYKVSVYWSDLKVGWASLDGHLADACAYDLNLILRVERDRTDWTPIRTTEMAAWEELFRTMAERIRQKRNACANDYRVALEVWNEPNLDMFWNSQPVDPARYTRMVQRAYNGARAGDPSTLVVAGGLAPTGGLPDGQAMNDITYLEQMYDAGLKGYFDAISTHNYGFGGPPEDANWGWGILNFRRAEDIHAVMVAHGDGDKPVWATEFGWLLDSDEEGMSCDDSWNAAGFGWQQVSAAQQADYLVRAFQYADANWPWMGVMVISNLDFSTTGWYDACEPMCWFSVLKHNGTPRPAYTALQAMAKRPRSWEVWGMAIEPAQVTLLADVDEPALHTRQVTVQNTDTGSWDTWEVVTRSAGLEFSVAPLTGAPGQGFTLQFETPTGVGVYGGVITTTASDARVPESPVLTPLTVYAVDEVHRIYLPLAGRGW